MKKFIKSMLVVLLVMTVLVGCDGKGGKEDDTLHVGFSLSTLQFPFYVRMKEGFEEAATEKGWKYTITDAKFDSETQLNDLQDLILQGVDVLVISSWYPDALTDIYEQAEEKEIPIFVIDMARISDDVNYISKMGTDNTDAGYMAGSWAAEYFKNDLGKTDMNLVTISPADKVPLDRIEGFKKGVEDAGIKLNLLHSFLGSETREDHMTAAEDALNTYDNIDLIFGLDAQAGLASHDAVLQAKRNEIKIIGMDGEEEELKLINGGDENYIATVTQFPDKMSKETIDNIEKYLAGEKIDRVIAFPSGITYKDGIIMEDEILKK